MDCFLGTILLWPMDWAPTGWALCNGQTLQVLSNQALFALIGNRFGGDGINTFCLPNLCGRVPVGMGVNPVYPATNYLVGQTGGTQTNTLAISNMAAHNHPVTVATTGMTCAASGTFTIPATSTAGNVGKPDTTSYLAQANKVGTTQVAPYNNVTTVTKDVQMPGGTVNVTGTVSGTATTTVGNTGSGAAVNNLQPYMVLNYIIATQGIFPTRD